MIFDNEITEAIVVFVQHLNNIGIDYYIGGSIASSSFGAFRSTNDVDF